MAAVAALLPQVTDALVVVLLGALAYRAARLRPGRVWERPLAAFLAVVAIGYAIGLVRWAFRIYPSPPSLAFADALPSLLDAALLVLAVEAMRGSVLRRSRALFAGLLAGFALVAALAGSGLVVLYGNPYRTIHAAAEIAIVGAYAAVLGPLVRLARDPEPAPERRIPREILAALVIVAASRVALGLGEIVGDLARIETGAATRTVRAFIAAAALATTLVLVSRLRARADAAVARWVGGVVVVGIALLGIYWSVPLLVLPEYTAADAAFDFHARSTFGIRWLLAAPLFAMGLREPGSQPDGRGRLHFAAFVGVVGLFVALAATSSLAQDDPSVMAIALIAVALVATLGAASFPGLASRLRGHEADARQIADVPPLAPGVRLLGRYVVERPLGHGAHGTTFAAWDSLIERRVAMKEIPTSAVGRAGLEAVQREARAAGRLSSAHIVALHDVVIGRDRVVLVIEYAPHGSLGDLLRREKRLDEDRARDVAAGVLRALAAAHARGIVHRDVKPGNVLFAEGFVAKLADFGLAIDMDYRETMASFVARPVRVEGTIAYIAPEQLAGDPIDARADLHAVAAMLVEMLAGRPYLPFTGNVVADRALVAEGEPDLDDVPARWRPTIARGLARAPELRFASAEEFLAALPPVARSSSLAP